MSPYDLTIVIKVDEAQRFQLSGSAAGSCILLVTRNGLLDDVAYSVCRLVDKATFASAVVGYIFSRGNDPVPTKLTEVYF